MTDLKPPSPVRYRAALCLAALAALASLGHYAHSLCYPLLVQDDFQILSQSWTWERTWANLWVPQNEHAMPLGRLLTFVVVSLAGRPTALPFAAALVGPISLLLGLTLVYRFVYRELGHPLYAVVAVVLFGVTAVYQQAVYWFAASFSILALDTLLLGLLAAQRYRRTGSLLDIGTCTLFCALSPCWFASGILAGPLCCLYLLPRERLILGEPRPTRANFFRRAVLRASPLLGSFLFLAVSLPLTARTIMHLQHYENLKTNALDAFQPGKGLLLSCQSVVENLLLGMVGIGGVSVPWHLVGVVLTVAFVAAWRWWQLAPDRRLLLLGLGMIFAGYMLVYSARARWFLPESGPMAPINEPRWSRYHLLPQLGLTLFICGGLPAWSRRLFVLKPDGSLTRGQVSRLGTLLILCYLIQLPHAILGANSSFGFTGQLEALRRIEAMDACCREHQISADAAVRVLPTLDIPVSMQSVNGWVFFARQPQSGRSTGCRGQSYSRAMQGSDRYGENRRPHFGFSAARLALSNWISASMR